PSPIRSNESSTADATTFLSLRPRGAAWIAAMRSARSGSWRCLQRCAASGARPAGRRVLADEHEDARENESKRGRPVVGHSPLRKRQPDENRAGEVDPTQPEEDPEPARGHAQLAPDAAGSDGEDREHQRDHEHETEEKATQQRSVNRYTSVLLIYTIFEFAPNRLSILGRARAFHLS